MLKSLVIVFLSQSIRVILKSLVIVFLSQSIRVILKSLVIVFLSQSIRVILKSLAQPFFGLVTALLHEVLVLDVDKKLVRNFWPIYRYTE